MLLIISSLREEGLEKPLKSLRSQHLSVKIFGYGNRNTS